MEVDRKCDGTDRVLEVRLRNSRVVDEDCRTRTELPCHTTVRSLLQTASVTCIDTVSRVLHTASKIMQSITDCKRQSVTENHLLAERRWQLSAAVGDSMHSESFGVSYMIVNNWCKQFIKIWWQYNHFPRLSTTYVILHDLLWPGK